jgi:hypothetical protein
VERRDFLRVGAGAVAGLTMARKAAAETPGADPSKFPTVVSTRRPTSCCRPAAIRWTPCSRA